MLKRFSASEILAMNLEGLPKTKAGLLARAEKEKWENITSHGLGGSRKLFTLPFEYLTPGEYEAKGVADVIPAPKGMYPAKRSRHTPDIGARGTSFAASQVNQVAGTIAAGSSKVDTMKLELAIRALTEWETERAVKIDPARRPAVIAILYDYLQNSAEDQGEEAMAMVLRALG